MIRYSDGQGFVFKLASISCNPNRLWDAVFFVKTTQREIEQSLDYSAVLSLLDDELFIGAKK